MELNRASFTIPITQLEDWLDLPEGTNIASIQCNGFNLTVQFLSDKEIDNDVQVEHIKDIGHVYRSL